MLIRNYDSKDLDEVINLFKNTIFEINISDILWNRLKLGLTLTQSYLMIILAKPTPESFLIMSS